MNTLFRLAVLTMSAYLAGCAAGGGTTGTEGTTVSRTRYATAGTSLTPEELERTRHRTRQEDVAIRYKLKAEGFPRDRIYSLWIERTVGGIPENRKAFERLRIEADDTVTTTYGTDLEFVLVRDRERRSGPDVLTDVPEGQSLVLTLVSDDRAVESWLRMTPFPVESLSDEGCRIAIEPQAAADRVLATIHGGGFQAGEKVEIRIVSRGSSAVINERASTNGSLRATAYPQGSADRRGTAAVTASGAKCSVATHFHWGE